MCLVMNINTFWGDLTYVSAVTKTLITAPASYRSRFVCLYSTFCVRNYHARNQLISHVYEISQKTSWRPVWSVLTLLEMSQVNYFWALLSAMSVTLKVFRQCSLL